MNPEKRQSETISATVAIIAMLVLGGLLLVPGTFIFYGGVGAALVGLLVLGVLILFQSAVFAIVKKLFRK